MRQNPQTLSDARTHARPHARTLAHTQTYTAHTFTLAAEHGANEAKTPDFATRKVVER